MKPRLLDDPEVSKALEIVEESAYSDEEKAAYEGYWDQVRREATIIGELNDAREELAEEKKNRDAAVAERDAANARADAATAERDAATAERDAAVEKLRQTVRNLKALNLTTEQIAAATGLSASEIETI